MSDEKWEPAPYKNYSWIVKDKELLGGKLAIRGTRFSVSFILGCLAAGMTLDEIDPEYAPFPHEALSEIMKVASEILESPDVAA